MIHVRLNKINHPAMCVEGVRACVCAYVRVVCVCRACVHTCVHECVCMRVCVRVYVVFVM